jgi:WD40 repeat protein
MAVVSGWEDGSLRVDDVIAGRLQLLVTDGVGDVAAPPRMVANGESPSTSSITCVEQSPLHPKQVICGYGDGHLRLWDLRSGRMCGKFSGGHGGQAVLSLCVPRYYQDGGDDDRRSIYHAVSAGADGVVQIWDCRKRGAVNSLVLGGNVLPSASARCVYDAFNNALLVGTGEGSVFEWEIGLL